MFDVNAGVVADSVAVSDSIEDLAIFRRPNLLLQLVNVVSRRPDLTPKLVSSLVWHPDVREQITVIEEFVDAEAYGTPEERAKRAASWERLQKLMDEDWGIDADYKFNRDECYEDD